MGQEMVRYPEQLVFGLDIGTRSIVGTVGYKEKNTFKVVAQETRLHETRAMLDGQVHDIGAVSGTIREIKEALEVRLNRKLKDVCIAAAGRVLKTINVRTDYEFPQETKVTSEQVYSLDLLGVEKAYEQIREENKDTDIKYYCVGYSVIHYYLNDYVMLNLEGHKADRIGAELIATFLPDEVIDGLYAAVEGAGLYVANLTLEPIAAINVAIPEQFRLLNIALVDVGAGTSDICITKDGSIIAYGMIPYAGDELSEQLAKHYLVDFDTAEKIKLSCLNRKSVTYKDIMGISHKVSTEEVLSVVEDTVKMITRHVSDKIKELNGGKAVSAVFVVGGGGKIPSFTPLLAEFLELPQERVAIRGPEVMQNIEFLQEGIKKDSLLVTPIGICLNFYEQKNNFIFVQVNGQRVKLYDNNKLTIVDAAVQIGFPNEDLFPKRGDAISYEVNQEKRMLRGEAGEAAVVKLNGKITGISAEIVQNDIIEIQPSTKGVSSKLLINQLPEYKDTICFEWNGQPVSCPCFVEVNGNLVSGYYEIKDQDQVVVRNYYTLEQVLDFMDVKDYAADFKVNHVEAQMDTKVYDNFSVECVMKKPEMPGQEVSELEMPEPEEPEKTDSGFHVTLSVNGTAVVLHTKTPPIFVNILDVYPFHVEEGGNRTLVKRVNGVDAEFTTPVSDGDQIDLYWEE
ncbi:MAG: cell division FtsA domain-containing protein [Clostridiales bacterium]|nr:cell division FtsA domain-containing protein [Clostridiales bacterium]